MGSRRLGFLTVYNDNEILRGGAWAWSRGSFSWFGTFIFGFLVQFWYRYQFSVQSNDIEILGGGAWVWSLPVIFGSRDLDFQFSRPFLHTGTNFQLNLTTLEFGGVGHMGVVTSPNFSVSGP